MKILHVISGDLWAGAEAQACTLLKALRNMDGVDVAAVVLNDGALMERLRSAQIKAILLPESTFGSLALMLKLRNLIAQLKPDIVHTHRFKENILGSIANALARNAPCLRTVHGAAEQNGRGFKRLSNLAIRKVDQICGRYLQKLTISVSAELAERIRAQFPQSRITVIENGVELEPEANHRDIADFRCNHPEGIHVGIVGRLVRIKRHDIFLDTAVELMHREPNRPWRFHIFGEGPLDDQIRARAKALGIESVTTLHGHRDDMRSCLASLTVLVICSDHEGLPMTLLEALSVGTPVAAHAVGGIPAVIHGLRGTRGIERHDGSAYADAVRGLVEVTREERKELELRISTRYSAEANAQRVYSAYCMLLRGG